MTNRIQLVLIVAAMIWAAVSGLSGCASVSMEPIETTQFNSTINNHWQTFNSTCLLKAPADYCQSMEKSLFQNNLPFQEFSPHEFMAADYPTDAKTLFQKMYSPRHTAALAYCYFVSKGLVDPKKVDPLLFPTVIGGFMITSSELPPYETWLKTDDGRQCRLNVKNSVGLSVMDLSGLLKDKLGLVALNPLILVLYKADINLVMKDMKTTLNHERIHLMNANCPALDAFARDFWANLDTGKKASFKKEIPEYNWDNPRIAVRESLAFTYEDDPAPLLDIAKRCKF